MKKGIVILICLISVITLLYGKIADFCVNDECLKENKHSRRRSNRDDIDEESDDEAHDYYYWNDVNKNTKSISFIDFIKSIFHMRINSSEFYKYIDGFKFIIKTFKDLYYQKQQTDDAEETQQYFNIVKEKIYKENSYSNANANANVNEAYSINDTLRQLEEQDDLENQYPNANKENNTDIYYKKTCPTVPDVKAQLRTYFCNDKQITKREYEKLVLDPTNKCEFYNNKDRICLCPVNYRDCLDPNQRLYCDIKELTVNSNTDLLKFRNTFYYEYFNKTILNAKDSPFKFSIGLRCAYVNQTIEQGNFYLSVGPEADFSFISINYPKNYEGEIIDYKDKDIRNVNTTILKYFLQSPKVIIYEEVSLIVSFSIFDLLWIIPRKVQTFELTLQQSADLISGKSNYGFEIDIKKLLAQEDTDPIFKNDIYPKQKKGNLLFYELLIYPKKRFNFQFFSFRGEIIDE